MKWFLLALTGCLLNGAGLAFLGQAIVHRTVEAGAFNAWFWDGLIAMLLINAGICLIVEAAKWRGRE
jgi:hypothetical protein